MVGRDEKMQDASDRDPVEIVGCVVAVDVRRGVFEVQTDDDRNIPVSFTQEQEPEVIGALMEYRNMRLRVKGRGEFDAHGQLQKILQAESLEAVWAAKQKSEPETLSLADMIEEIFKDVPDEVWEKIPRDLSHRHDFYLYGGDE